MIKTGNRTQ